MDAEISDLYAQVCLSPDNSVLFATRIMSEYRAGTIVLKRRGAVVGVVTGRILRQGLAVGCRDPETTPLSEIMMVTPAPTPNAPFSAAMA
jgi:CBS domain-containing protein